MKQTKKIQGLANDISILRVTAGCNILCRWSGVIEALAVGKVIAKTGQS